MHFPSFEQFQALASKANLVPVYRKLLSDTQTPVSAFLKIDRGTCSCLFESVVGGEKVGRYSFLTADPYEQFEARGHMVRRVRLNADGSTEATEYEAADPLAELEAMVANQRSAIIPGLPPFCGGAVGYAGYDTVRYVERLPNAPPDERNLPDMAFALYGSMVVFDHIHKTLFVIVLAQVDEGTDLKAAYDGACGQVDELVGQLEKPGSELQLADLVDADPEQLEVRSNFRREDFESAVERCLEYIRAGDIFQVVISQRLQTTITVPPLEIYRTLRVVNPSPFMFYLRTPSVTLVGSSPEIMVRVKDGEVITRPLAGTRPRGETPEEDRRLAEELLADPKERAEHVMLVDLGRNDIGRVARFGTVELSDVMTIERYSHVMHITSNVRGMLDEGRTAFDALRACLPVGTVSGAPKVRAMEIIDELEPQRRGPYAGAVGYIDFNGNMDTCIALRTLVIQGDQAYVQVGAGIVADSIPANEYQETLNKARGLLKALAMTESRCGRQADRNPSPSAG